jgi:DNA-binding GntR family transcriptional regulator
MAVETKAPFYFRVAETLKGRIDSRKYHPGEIVPSEKELAREFGVSTITIKKAMHLLVDEGLVVRQRGVGTTVVRKEKEPVAIKLTGNFREWFDSVSGKFPKLEIDVLDVGTIPCPEHIRKRLAMPPRQDIWRMKRLRRFRNEPISYYINFAPPGIFDNIDQRVFEKRPFFEVLQEQFQNRITKIDQRVEAIVADMDVSSVLGIQFGEPLFYSEIIYFDNHDRPVEVTHLFLRGDRYVYRSVIRLNRSSEGGIA